VLGTDKEGTLWIGTGNGLVKFKNEKFSNLADADHTFFVESMWVDNAAHTIWLGTRNSGLFLYDIEKNTYTRNENKYSKDLINAIISDGAGGIWVGTEKNGLGHYTNGEWIYYGHEDGL
jgi:ligand-binding sensor domain-containing protein